MNATASPLAPIATSAAATARKTTEEPTDAITSPILIGKNGKNRRIKPFLGLDASDDHNHSSLTSHSLSDAAKHATRSQNDLDQRRNSFSAMAADGRAQLRRRSHDFTDFASLPLPPSSSSSGFLQPRSKNHVHMRVYGKADTDTARILTARQSEGAALVDVLCPSPRTIWRRGQPVCIEWKVLDDNVEFVQIDLMEEGSSATTMIAKAAPNNGFFTYNKVPWGMQCGSTYFLRVSSTADPSRYMTTAFFHIGSAP